MSEKAATVYLVGGAESLKTNQWSAMTNNWAEAERLKLEIGPTATHKVVQVKPQRRTGGQR